MHREGFKLAWSRFDCAREMIQVSADVDMKSRV